MESIKENIPDSNLFYKIGKSPHKAHHFLKTAVGMPLIGPKKMIEFIQRENDKYNRTKDIVILKLENDHVVFRAVYHNGIVPSSFGMQWGSGLLESYILLSGATNVEVMVKCIDKGPQKPGDEGKGVYEFEARYNKKLTFFNELRSPRIAEKTLHLLTKNHRAFIK